MKTDLAQRPRCYALVGNPNVGKTALFNALTGLHQRVANYAGVTVERREGRMLGGSAEVRIVDLPGVRSLVPRSADEEITTASLLREGSARAEIDGAVVVLDATQLRRGLFLLSQVIETGIPVLVCVNMADEAELEGCPVDSEGLKHALQGLPVIVTSATTGAGMETLRAHIAAGIEPASVALAPIPGFHSSLPPSPARWHQLREAVAAGGLEQQEVAARWRFSEQILSGVRASTACKLRGRSDRIDRWCLHAVFGPLLFLLIMGAVFQGVFWLATPAVDGIESLFTHLVAAVHGVLGDGMASRILSEGVLAGVGAVVVFLPQILILFLFLIILEDSGYLARAAFIADRPFAAIGLSGRSFAPLISSYACAVPGILGLRSVDDERERRLAMLVAPLLTCSARLPIYTLLIAAFIPADEIWGFLNIQGLVLLGLYVLGGVLALGAAAVMDRVLRRAAAVPLLMELPIYRFPAARTLVVRLAQRAGVFLRRAGTIILGFSLAVWFLTNFPSPEVPPTTALERAAAMEASFAGQLGHAIEPLIQPLGFDWRLGIGIIASLAAREIFNSTMSVVLAVSAAGDPDAGLVSALQSARTPTGAPLFDLATVVALLVFYAVALQCVSTIAVVARESGSWRFALGQFAAFTLLAWVSAWTARNLCLLAMA